MIVFDRLTYIVTICNYLESHFFSQSMFIVMGTDVCNSHMPLDTFLEILPS